VLLFRGDSAIDAPTREISSIGAVFPLRDGKSGTVVFDVKANRYFETCGRAFRLRNEEKPIA
jgi:hypothetical protein